MTPRSRKAITQDSRVSELLELFYPVHYKACIALEDEMRAGQLSRKQTAILWLIRSEGSNGERMRRKDIERLLQSWFEVSSSAITKALRGMARPPLNLLEIVEDPASGREKQVSLTAKGHKFLQVMVEQGRRFLHPIVEQLTVEEVAGGIRYLRKAVAILEVRQSRRDKNVGTSRPSANDFARATKNGHVNAP
ncbi:MAG: MarR family winged helix-turn-helix transcriptional regulator [Candidatus Binataceae bacterium]